MADATNGAQAGGEGPYSLYYVLALGEFDQGGAVLHAGDELSAVRRWAEEWVMGAQGRSAVIAACTFVVTVERRAIVAPR